MKQSDQNNKNPLRFAVAAAIASGLFYLLTLTRYAKVDEVSTVEVPAKNKISYIIIVTEETMHRFGWANFRALINAAPESNEISVRRMRIIETDGKALRDTVAPAYLYPGWKALDREGLYLSDRPGNEGTLYSWNDGVATPVESREAAMIRERNPQYTTDQAKINGWNYRSNILACIDETLQVYDPGVKGSKDQPTDVNVAGNALRFRFTRNPPSNPRAPAPDQVMKLEIYCNTKLFHTIHTNYKMTNRSITQKDWIEFSNDSGKQKDADRRPNDPRRASGTGPKGILLTGE